MNSLLTYSAACSVYRFVRKNFWNLSRQVYFVQFIKINISWDIKLRSRDVLPSLCHTFEYLYMIKFSQQEDCRSILLWTLRNKNSIANSEELATTLFYENLKGISCMQRTFRTNLVPCDALNFEHPISCYARYWNRISWQT